MSPALTRREFAHSAFAISATQTTFSKTPKAAALVAFRVSHYHWVDDRRFEGLLAFFAKQPGTADELAFFTAGTHPPRPLDEMRSRAELLSKRIAAVRERGMEAGINVLATIGHLDENLDTSLDEPWQRMVDPEGRQPRGSYCPAGREFLGYVGQVYSAMAQASPAFIWIDDDVRIAHHPPIDFACFCDVCLRNFSAETGRQFTRSSLIQAFGSGTLEERFDLRRRWMEHNRATIDNLLRVIETAAHRVKPDVSLGYMTGPMAYERAGFASWAKTLAGPRSQPVRWRPGGGFYSEERLVELAQKAHMLGRQAAALPLEVQVIQSEIENFPYDLLRKSSFTTVVEAATHMAAGTTGTAFNVLGQRPDPLEEFEPLLARIHAAKPFYEVLRRELGRTPVTGIWPAWNGDMLAANNANGSWPAGPQDAMGASNRSFVLGEIGIPVCYSQDGAVSVALAGPSVLAFSKDELRKMLAGGVLMDAAALVALQSLGLADLAGVRPAKRFDKDAIEQLAKHPVNGRFAGWSRDCRQSFWHEPAVVLEPSSDGVEVLAKIIDYQDRELGNSLTVFENKLGGRVAVMGYFPWTQIHNLPKSSQMKALCNWLSRGRLPALVESFARVHVWVRRISPERSACYVLNGSLEPLAAVSLRLPGRYAKLEWVSLDGVRRPLRPSGTAETSTRVETPPLAAWTPGLLLAAR